jgi:hypothetical protein
MDRRLVLAGSAALGMLVGCGSHQPSRLERAEYRAWADENRHVRDQYASCDRRGDAFTLRGRTYTAYVCTVHGGSAQTGGGTTFAAYWNGRQALSCTELPRAAQDALCFD